ncbi:MAG: ribonuclease D [Gammaproteobacteria bacterium]|nr:MAG: ribonuclease D [Gammaproteobacteria bacterium]
MTNPERPIDSPAALAELCRALRGEPHLAVDTEFVREKTYRARLCLVQIAAAERLAAVDVLAFEPAALAPLWALLTDPGIVKVFHSAAQDFEVLLPLLGRLPEPLFDTQVAAALLGYGDQVGYAALVEAVLGVRLEKAETRTDWSRRPLSAAQLRYALDDVRHLHALYPRLAAALAERGRLAWLADEQAVLLDPARYRPDPDNAWRRLRGARRLKPRTLNVLRHLAAWREREAVRLDRPRRWVVDDETLLNIAAAAPADETALAAVRGVEARLVEHYGRALLDAVARARAEPPSAWPEARPARRTAPARAALVDALAAIVRLAAEAHDLSPAQLAGREALERLAAGEREGHPLLTGWRARVVGAALVDFIEGRTRLVADAERGLRLEPV